MKSSSSSKRKNSSASGGQQQQSAPKSSGRQQEAASGEGKQYGEGNYKATREYNAGLKRHLESSDVEREAREAAPRNSREEREMDEAERIGRSHAQGNENVEDSGKGPDNDDGLKR